MNALDIGAIVVLVFFVIFGYRRGLVDTAFQLFSFFASIFLAVRLYPPVARTLRESFIFESIRLRIARSANFEATFRENMPSPDIGEAARSSNIINALPVPEPLRYMLYNYNTPDMYEVLRVSTVEEYVTGFFANIVINIIALLIVFVLVFIALRVVGAVLRIVDKLPIISSINRVGGLVAGALIGFGVVWLGLTVLTMFFSSGGNDNLYGLLQGSVVVGWVLGSDWLTPSITVV